MSDDTSADCGPIDNPFNESTSRSDLVLLVEDKRLYVNKVVMAIASPVFEAMLGGEFKEKGLSEIPLPDKKHKDVLQFLKCIYPSVLQSICKENLDSVLPLSEEYQVLPLKERCEAHVLSRLDNKNEAFSDEDLLHYLYLADKYHLTTLVDVCIDNMENRTLHVGVKTIHQLTEYELLSNNTKVKLLTSRVKRLETTILPPQSMSFDTPPFVFNPPSWVKKGYR